MCIAVRSFLLMTAVGGVLYLGYIKNIYGASQVFNLKRRLVSSAGTYCRHLCIMTDRAERASERERKGEL